MSLVLKYNDLSIGYGDKIISANLSGELSSGEVLQITGGNGSGKTTLVKTLLGELKPVSGEVRRDFVESYHLQQNYHESIHLPLTVSEILDGETSEIPFESSLKWNDLSGGQKQQALILKSFKQLAEIIVLDEPLNHLDQESVGIVSKLINKKINENKKLAVIIISHIPIELNCEVREVTL